MATFVDHYTVLGITSTATPADIKKAYRQLALQHHPDKAAPAGKVDAARFISAQAAYEVLGDINKRKAYDIQYNRRSKTAHASRFAHKQATRAAQAPQRETDGSYGGWYVPEWIRRGRETVIEEDYPSDTPTDPDSDCEDSGVCKDSGVYEDGYADPYYKAHRTCKGVVCGSLDTYGGYDFDSTSTQYHFPDDFADDFDCPPAQGSDESEDQIDNDNPTLQISEPLSEAFDAFANMSKSHYLEEKVLGRYYKGALFELLRQKTKCDNIDAQLVDIAARVRGRVSKIPAGSFKSGEFEEALSRKMGAAHGAVGVVRLATDAALRVMRVEQQPQFWKLMEKRAWSVTETIERSATHMEEMVEALSGLEEIVIMLEGWSNEELDSVKSYLGSFMRELRDWRKEITPSS